MQRYKFQAMLTTPSSGTDPELGPSPRRIVLRTEDDQTRRSRFFTTLISCDGETAPGPGRPCAMVTLRVIGDHVDDVLGVGSRFHLWLGSDIAEGVISRRLFTWPA